MTDGFWAAPAGREWPPVDLMDYSQRLRRLIADDKVRYDEFRKILVLRYPEPWVAVGYALKTRARYYRGEIFRAKRDLQRYMLGQDPKKPSNYGEILSDWITEYLYEIPKIIDDIDAHWSELGGLESKSPKAEFVGSLWGGDKILLESTQNSLLKAAKEMEKIIYGG